MASMTHLVVNFRVGDSVFELMEIISDLCELVPEHLEYQADPMKERLSVLLGKMLSADDSEAIT